MNIDKCMVLCRCFICMTYNILNTSFYNTKYCSIYKFNTKILKKYLNNDTKKLATAELLVHKCKSKTFYNNIKKIIEIFQQNKKVFALILWL